MSRRSLVFLARVHAHSPGPTSAYPPIAEGGKRTRQREQGTRKRKNEGKKDEREEHSCLRPGLEIGPFHRMPVCLERALASKNMSESGCNDGGEDARGGQRIAGEVGLRPLASMAGTGECGVR